MMTKRFEGRAVFVTGAGSGVGAATAKLLAGEGARVFAADVNAAGVEETVAAIRAAGGEADGSHCDVTSMASVCDAVGRAVAACGGLDILVNAAGIGGMVRFEKIDDDLWQRTIAVNLTGVFHTTKAAMDHLLAKPGGNIVNVASIAAMRGQAYTSHYSASKAGLVNFTRSIAMEFATRGLRANCVSPGGVISPFLQNFIPGEDFEMHLIGYYLPPVPNQMSMPEDVANTIAFLASDDARMVNGATLIADGGTLA